MALIRPGEPGGFAGLQNILERRQFDRLGPGRHVQFRHQALGDDVLIVSGRA
jgi:hypothetical protein